MKKLTALLAILGLIGLQVAFAQTRSIKGTISSKEDGMGLPGANVSVKGTSIGTATDFDGNFTLNVAANATTLVISSIGYQTVEVPIQEVVNVILAEDSKDIEEVIVTGYASKGKNSITGSAVQLKGDEIKNVPVLSADQALQGKVAGLAISGSSGSPGAIQDIRIRGVGSLTANNNPLYVIDGVPVMNDNISGSVDSDGTTPVGSTLSPLSALNSSDIENITVLKDASATSAYGARGSNGVIVITTKKGKAGKTSYNLASYYGFQNKANKGRKVLTGAQKEELLLEGIYNSFGAANNFTKDQAYAYAMATPAIATSLVSLNAWIAAGRPDNDWEKVMENDNAVTENVVFSAQGGSAESSFYTSLAYNKTESVVIGSDFKRVNGALNFTKNFTEKIKFSTNNSVSNVRQEGVINEQGAYYSNPIMSKYFVSPWISPRTADGQPNLNLGGVSNWLYLKDHDITYNDMTRAISNSNVEVEIVKDFKFKSLIGIDYLLNNYKSYNNRHHGDGLDVGGSSNEAIMRNFNLVTQNSLSYSITVNDHYLSAMALIEYQKNKQNDLSGYGEKFVTDGLTNINSAGANWKSDAQYQDWLNTSYLGMLNYSYLGRYIADFTFRREGSSRFGKGQRFGNFWSIGGAWNISKEEFFANFTGIVNNLKLRSSYGISGNAEIDLNSYQALLGFDADYAGSGAVYPSTYGNPVLTWEKNNSLDFGLDFGIYNNRVSGSISYFNRTTTDLLQNVPLTLTSGHSSITQNIGAAVNKGVEFLVDIQAVKTNDLNINVSFNFATLNNEVTELAKGGDGKYIVIETATRKIDVGHPYYEWYMRKYAGVNPANGKPQWYVNGNNANDGITENYTAAKQGYQGASAIPTLTGGASLHVDYKGIYLDASVYYAGGHKVFEDWASYNQSAGLNSILKFNGAEVLMDRWQKPGDKTDVPIILYDQTANRASSASTRFLFDGDYLRLKDLVVGYHLPSSLLTKIGYKGTASVYARGTNLLTWVKDSNMKYDPEVRADGYTNLTNPPVKAITFGLNLNF